VLINAQTGSACSGVGALRTLGKARTATAAGVVHAMETGFTIHVAVTEFSGLSVALTETIAGAIAIAVWVLESRHHHRVARCGGPLTGRTIHGWLSARRTQWVRFPARGASTQCLVGDTGAATVTATFRILDTITERIVLAVTGQIDDTVVVAAPSPAAAAIWARTALQWVQSDLDTAIAGGVALDVVLAGTWHSTAPTLGAPSVDTLALPFVTFDVLDAGVAIVTRHAGITGPCDGTHRRIADEARVFGVRGACRHAPNAIDAAES
jgi:hypothetical protein